MKNTGRLGWPREFFNPTMTRQNITSGAASPPRAQRRGERPVAWRCEVLRTVGTTPNGVASTKMFPDHLRWMAREIRIADWFPELRWIHFRREDKLAQAISAAIAEQTKVWQGEPAAQAAEPVFSVERIDALLGFLLRSEAMWTGYFLRNRIDPLRLTYEETDRDPAASVQRIAAHLRVTLDSPPEIETPYVRQRTSLNEKWRERYLSEVGDLNVVDGLPVPQPGPLRRFFNSVGRTLRRSSG
jgi:LPS sulfotransferase NodH